MLSLYPPLELHVPDDAIRNIKGRDNRTGVQINGLITVFNLQQNPVGRLPGFILILEERASRKTTGRHVNRTPFNVYLLVFADIKRG